MSKKKSSEVYAQIQELLSEYTTEVNGWVRFSKQESAITAEVFVQTLVLGWLKKKDASLNELAHTAGNWGITITGSALHERIGHTGLMLLAGVLKLALERLHTPAPLSVKQLSQFTGIYITDSTQIALPAHLRDIFRGAKANAMLKLQVVWDYLNGNVMAVELEAGRKPDQKCRLHVTQAQVGSLQLFDLGYFKQENLRDIEQQKAYFVSRYQSQTALYVPDDDQRIELVKWLRTRKCTAVEREVLLGGRVKLPVRLVARQVSQTRADARRRQAKKKAKRQGKTCSADYLYLLGWDILVTNLSSDNWSLSQVFDLYGIRFQIEWMFRIWKTNLGIDMIGAWRIERVLCQLYAHLIGIILIHLLLTAWRWQAVEYSTVKIVQLIQAALSDLIRCVARNGWGFTAWFKRLQQDIRQFGRITKRRTSLSTVQIINNWGAS